MTAADVSNTTGTPGANLAGCEDLALVRRIQAGDSHLYATLMRRHNQRLFRIARSILPDDNLAEDAVQEAYVAAFYALERYVPRGKFAAWLSQITINEARMIRRKRMRRKESSLSGIDDGPSAVDPQPRANPANDLANVHLARLIEAQIAKLPEPFRLVFVLRGVQQLSIEDTANTLQIPAATVKTRYHRARNLLQKALTPYIEGAGVNVYEFAGQRCDNLVSHVLRRLGLEDKQPRT